MTPYFYLTTDYEEEVADLFIFGDIASEGGGLSGLFAPSSDVSSHDIAVQINDVPATYPINVHINSNGGEVAEGLAIYNVLKSRGNVTTICEGFAASAGSVIFAAGDKRIMQPASLLFIHQALVATTGNADDLEKTAEDLRIITDTIVNAYLESGVNLSRDEIMEMLKAETWITPESAVKLGFATSIQDVEESEDVAKNDAMASIMNMVTRPEPVLDNVHEYEHLSALAGKAEQILNANPELIDKLNAFLDKVTSAPKADAPKGFFNFGRKSGKEE